MGLTDTALRDLSRGKKTLIVDDEQFMRSAISNILNEIGFEYGKNVGSGEEALNYLSKGNKVDIVILDATLPKLSGGEVLKIIRTSDKIPNNDITVIMMTAGASQNELAAFAKHKISGYLSKPITPKALRATMERVLKAPVGEVVEAPE